MTSFARICSPLVAQAPAEIVAQLAAGARLAVEPWNGGWHALRLSGGGLDLRLVETGIHDDAGLMERIGDMRRFVVAATPRGPTAPAWRVHRFVGRARHVIELEGIDVHAPRHQSFLLDLARLVYGVAQIPRGFLDSEGRWLLDATGASAADAGPRVVEEALARRRRSIQTLAAGGIRIPDGLSLVESEREAIECSAADVKLRCLALWSAFRQTCGAPELRIERDDLARTRVEASLTQRERRAIAASDKNACGWGVESLWALLFVLGSVRSLAPLGVPCDATTAMEVLDDHTSKGALDGGQRRPVGEILDALDQHQLLAWAAAEGGGRLAPPMSAPAVAARLRALRWAVMHQYAAWDEVDVDA